MIDYIVMEAVAIKARRQEEEAQEKQKRDDWKGETDHLKKYQ